MATDHAPILSTPAEHIFEDPTPVALPQSQCRLSEEQLYLRYEIQRTIDEVRQGRWKRIALQFPDDMLIDALRVFEALRDGLSSVQQSMRSEQPGRRNQTLDDISMNLQAASLHAYEDTVAPGSVDAKLTILADTSYGACCVDEVAAEHVDADVVVHYGRSCLSPTARLPVVYVFTTKPLDLDAVVESFKTTYQDLNDKVCLMADIPYNSHLNDLQHRLAQEGYSNVFKTNIVRDPSSLLPNRTVPGNAQENPEVLKEYSIFHIATPPTPLLLILSSRIRSLHIFPTDTPTPTSLEASTAQLLRRRYALLTRLSTIPIFGILINTLSVSNYMAALKYCQDIINRAGKKSYVFVVGKVNAAKVANFSEIGGWVVIGCWESSLIESKDFYRPIITPYELEVALMDDDERVWGGEWIGDFSTLLGRNQGKNVQAPNKKGYTGDQKPTAGEGAWDEEPSDEEPPEFDLRTGRYVSQSRPMGRPKRTAVTIDSTSTEAPSAPAPLSSALVQRAKGDIASISGQVSPAAEFLRSKRTWQGLGSDHEVAYERDENGKIRGAAMEEGRSGVAKGYSVGDAGEAR